MGILWKFRVAGSKSCQGLTSTHPQSPTQEWLTQTSDGFVAPTPSVTRVGSTRRPNSRLVAYEFSTRDFVSLLPPQGDS